MKQYLIAFIFFIFCVVPSFAQSADTLKIVSLQYPPYQYIEDGIIKGCAYEIIEEVFKRLGYNFDMEIIPWSRALYSLQNGKADAVFTIYKTEEREKYLDFTKEVLINQEIALFKLKGSRIDFNGDFRSVREKVIGTVYSVNYGMKFDKALIDLSLQTVDSVDGEANFRNLLFNRVDLLINNVAGANYLIDMLDIHSKVEIIYPVIEAVPSFLAFSKHHDYSGLKFEYEEELKKLKQDGTYNKILAKYIR